MNSLSEIDADAAAYVYLIGVGLFILFVAFQLMRGANGPRRPR